MLGILKDKVSILKASLVISSKPTKFFNVAVLRATTYHNPSDPPPIDAVLALAHNHRPSTGVIIHALLRRLHGTHNAYVALKCLLTLHHLLNNSKPALKDQIMSYSNGPIFDMSNFRDESDRDTWELSDWVRWYADVLVYSISRNRGERLNWLVGMVEIICKSPDSLYYQKLGLIYEVMKLIGEDYRMIMREITNKINQFGNNKRIIEDLNDDLLEDLLGDLKRLKNCRQKLFLMFLNKKNDGIWELIDEVEKHFECVKEKRKNMRLVMFQGTESTRVADNRVSESTQLAVVPVLPRGKKWLDVEWNRLVVV
ncbi:unnamed protein product [Amaranthus hypochondriacus]